MWISIEQSVMVSGIAYVFMGFVVRDWLFPVEFINYGGPTGALTVISHYIICSIYVFHWMRVIRFCRKILAGSDTEYDCAIHCSWSFHLTCMGENGECIAGIP